MARFELSEKILREKFAEKMKLCRQEAATHLIENEGAAVGASGSGSAAAASGQLLQKKQRQGQEDKVDSNQSNKQLATMSIPEIPNDCTTRIAANSDREGKTNNRRYFELVEKSLSLHHKELVLQIYSGEIRDYGAEVPVTCTKDIFLKDIRRIEVVRKLRRGSRLWNLIRSLVDVANDDHTSWNKILFGAPADFIQDKAIAQTNYNSKNTTASTTPGNNVSKSGVLSSSAQKNAAGAKGVSPGQSTPDQENEKSVAGKNLSHLILGLKPIVQQQQQINNNSFTKNLQTNSAAARYYREEPKKPSLMKVEMDIYEISSLILPVLLPIFNSSTKKNNKLDLLVIILTSEGKVFQTPLLGGYGSNRTMANQKACSYGGYHGKCMNAKLSVEFSHEDVSFEIFLSTKMCPQFEEIAGLTVGGNIIGNSTTTATTAAAATGTSSASAKDAVKLLVEEKQAQFLQQISEKRAFLFDNSIASSAKIMNLQELANSMTKLGDRSHLYNSLQLSKDVYLSLKFDVEKLACFLTGKPVAVANTATTSATTSGGLDVDGTGISVRMSSRENQSTLDDKQNNSSPGSTLNKDASSSYGATSQFPASVLEKLPSNTHLGAKLTWRNLKIVARNRGRTQLVRAVLHASRGCVLTVGVNERKKEVQLLQSINTAMKKVFVGKENSSSSQMSSPAGGNNAEAASGTTTSRGAGKNLAAGNSSFERESKGAELLGSMFYPEDDSNSVDNLQLEQDLAYFHEQTVESDSEGVEEEEIHLGTYFDENARGNSPVFVEDTVNDADAFLHEDSAVLTDESVGEFRMVHHNHEYDHNDKKTNAGLVLKEQTSSTEVPHQFRFFSSTSGDHVESATQQEEQRNLNLVTTSELQVEVVDHDELELASCLADSDVEEEFTKNEKPFYFMSDLHNGNSSNESDMDLMEVPEEGNNNIHNNIRGTRAKHKKGMKPHQGDRPASSIRETTQTSGAAASVVSGRESGSKTSLGTTQRGRSSTAGGALVDQTKQSLKSSVLVQDVVEEQTAKNTKPGSAASSTSAQKSYPRTAAGAGLARGSAAEQVQRQQGSNASKGSTSLVQELLRERDTTQQGSAELDSAEEDENAQDLLNTVNEPDQQVEPNEEQFLDEDDEDAEEEESFQPAFRVSSAPVHAPLSMQQQFEQRRKKREFQMKPGKVMTDESIDDFIDFQYENNARTRYVRAIAEGSPEKAVKKATTMRERSGKLLWSVRQKHKEFHSGNMYLALEDMLGPENVLKLKYGKQEIASSQFGSSGNKEIGTTSVEELLKDEDSSQVDLSASEERPEGSGRGAFDDMDEDDETIEELAKITEEQKAAINQRVSLLVTKKIITQLPTHLFAEGKVSSKNAAALTKLGEQKTAREIWRDEVADRLREESLVKQRELAKSRRERMRRKKLAEEKEAEKDLAGADSNTQGSTSSPADKMKAMRASKFAEKHREEASRERLKTDHEIWERTGGDFSTTNESHERDSQMQKQAEMITKMKSLSSSTKNGLFSSPTGLFASAAHEEAARVAAASVEQKAFGATSSSPADNNNFYSNQSSKLPSLDLLLEDFDVLELLLVVGSNVNGKKEKVVGLVGQNLQDWLVAIRKYSPDTAIVEKFIFPAMSRSADEAREQRKHARSGQ